MKLSNFKFGVDETTFAPIVTMNCVVTLDSLQDAAADMTADELALIVGKEFLQQLKTGAKLSIQEWKK